MEIIYILLACGIIFTLIYMWNNAEPPKGGTPNEDYTFIYFHDFDDWFN